MTPQVMLFLFLVVAALGRQHLSYAFTDTSCTQYRLESSSPTNQTNNTLTFLSKKNTASAQLNGKPAPLVLHSRVTSSGMDGLGFFQDDIQRWAIQGDPNNVTVLESKVRSYPEMDNILVFGHSFPNGGDSTSIGNRDGVSSSFLSLMMENPTTGFVHLAGLMGGTETQYGLWDVASSAALQGGMRLSGVIALFNEKMDNTLVISPLDQFMTSSLAVKDDAVQWGVMGNASNIPKEFAISFIVVAFPNGVNKAVRKWGALLLQYYGKTPSFAHERDLTLQYLGYSTDNGAFYYYYQGANHTSYQNTILDVKNYSVAVGLPYAYVELDSWWYYKGAFDGVKNWTSMPTIFPGGMQAVHKQTEWPIQAHNRYFAQDNVYAANPLSPVGPTMYSGPTFNFTWGTKYGLPTTFEFWDSLFSMNQDWGLTIYEQDWLSQVVDDVTALNEDVIFGMAWLRQMDSGCSMYGLSIQYCTSTPRFILSTLLLNSVTQARASHDYLPSSLNKDFDQWQIGESSLLMESIGIAPSKDDFWTMPTPQWAPHYTNKSNTSETRNRLQALAASLSNGPVQPADRIGFSDVPLLMKSCRRDGLLLRPEVSATTLDRCFSFRAGLGKGLVGTVIATFSQPSSDLRYVHLLSLLNNITQSVTFSEINDVASVIHDDSFHRPDYYLAYEANTTTSNFTQVTESTPLFLSPSNEYTFLYLHLIPVYIAASSGWYLQGEVDKWISTASQRFRNVIMRLDGSIDVTVSGAPNEVAVVQFVEVVIPFRVVSAQCVIGESGVARVSVAANGIGTCM